MIYLIFCAKYFNNMSTIQVVFLFDLNACADFIFCPKEELSKRLLYLRIACLRLLNNFSSKYPSLKWGAKFFDSQGSKNQTMCKFAFADFSLENFETLENEICVRYERHLSILQALLESSQNNLSSNGDESNVSLPIKLLQLALTQVLCEFQWETMDMWSPSYTKIKERKRNFLFAFSNFKDNDELLYNYFGLSNSVSKPKFMNIFLPQSLRDSIVKKADIHLVLLNMCEDIKFMGSFSSDILPLLSDTLNSLQGSFIPLCILSQPLFDFKLLSDLERNMCKEKELMLLNFPVGYQNSFIAFSTLFDQSLNHPFYSKTTPPMYDCCIDFTTKNIQIPVQIMEISNKNPDLYEDVSMKVASSVGKKWSKFIVHCIVPKGVHFPASKALLCLPSSHESSSSYPCLEKLNEYLNISGFSMLLECVIEDGKKLPGLLNSLSCDSAIVSVFDPSFALKLGGDMSDCSFSNTQDFQSILDEIQNICGKNKDLLNVELKCSVIPKPFKIQCLENKYKPQKFHNLASKTSSNSLKMNEYSNLLKQSVAKNRDIKSKQAKRFSANGPESNGANQMKIMEEQLPDTLLNDAQMKDLEELLPDVSYEDLLSTIRDAYNTAIETSVSALMASGKIMKIVISYYKKHNETSYQEDVSAMLRDNILTHGRDITQKYEALDSKEAAEKIIKECQIQIILNLELENLKKDQSPDKSSCVNTVTSLLRTAEFYFMYKEMLQLGGLKERRIFLNDILKKNYGDSLHDILEECVHEFEDSESSPGSPAETISSEFNNEEELFSSVVSSTLSEVSSSSAGSCKINNKHVKHKNNLSRKLIRRRSDISDTVRYRQVLLPKSSPKKKKAKVVANKAVRYSPRLAAKRNEHNKSACDKTNKVRRNLFAGDKVYRTPLKKESHMTPKSKKKNFVSKTKLAAETPAHKQNFSAWQRRKSFMEQSSSPKVIAESPTIRKTAKDDASKELLEKLLKVKQPLNTAVEQKPRLPSFEEHTPESKRRLSLKLFSKILYSPTARQGIKKCTKRLFDQISPQKSVESCKKLKTSNDSAEEHLNLFAKNEALS